MKTLTCKHDMTERPRFIKNRRDRLGSKSVVAVRDELPVGKQECTYLSYLAGQTHRRLRKEGRSHLLHTSHRVLDPQNASDKVRRLAEHPDSPDGHFSPHLCSPERLSQLFTHNHGQELSRCTSHHLLPDEQPQPHGLLWNRLSANTPLCCATGKKKAGYSLKDSINTKSVKPPESRVRGALRVM